MFSLAATRPRAPAAGFQPGASRTRVLRCLGPRDIKNVVFSRVWGAMAPKASLVTCLVRLGQQNHPQRLPKLSLLLYRLACWFEGRVFVAFCVLSSSVRPSIRSRRRSRKAVFVFPCGLKKGIVFTAIVGTFLVHLASESFKKALQNRA